MVSKVVWASRRHQSRSSPIPQPNTPAKSKADAVMEGPNAIDASLLISYFACATPKDVLGFISLEPDVAWDWRFLQCYSAGKAGSRTGPASARVLRLFLTIKNVEEAGTVQGGSGEENPS